MFGATIVNLAAPPSLLPRPRPAEAETASSESKSTEPRGYEPKGSDLRASERTSDAKSVDSKNSDPMANLVKATTTPSPSPQPAVTAAVPEHLARSARPQPSPQPSTTASLSPSSNVVRPPASTPALTGARCVAAVQRALTEYGYAQLKPTGTMGSDTQAAIQRFERDRKLPVTGQVSDRMVRELSAMIGHP